MMVRIILKIITDAAIVLTVLLSVIILILWFITEPGFEPIHVFVSNIISALLAFSVWLYNKNSERKTAQLPISEALSNTPTDSWMIFATFFSVLISSIVAFFIVEPQKSVIILGCIVIYGIILISISRRIRKREYNLIKKYSNFLDGYEGKFHEAGFVDFLMTMVRDGDEVDLVLQANILLDYLIDKRRFIKTQIAPFRGRKILAKLIFVVANESLYKLIRKKSIDSLIKQIHKNEKMPATVAALKKEMERRAKRKR